MYREITIYKEQKPDSYVGGIGITITSQSQDKDLVNYLERNIKRIIDDYKINGGSANFLTSNIFRY